MSNTPTPAFSEGMTPLQPSVLPNLNTGLTPTEKKNLDYLVEKQGYTENQALELVKNEEVYEVLKKQFKQNHELINIDLISTLQKVAKEKAEAGFGESAQKLITGIAILMDKTYGDFSKQSGPMFNVAGKQVSIKVGFGFKPYQKK